MILCDIGNTTAHFFDGKDDFKISSYMLNPLDFKEQIYYICVNQKLKNNLNTYPNWIDLSLHVEMQNYYKTMGIDRIMACEAIENGLIIDAGSAITVDIVRDGNFMGGFIYPGKHAMQECYKNISNALDYSFNFELPLDKMPKNSADAISYGYIKTLYSEVVSHGIDIYLTGGDALEFKKIFKNAVVDKKLLFKGMEKVMKKANLC